MAILVNSATAKSDKNRLSTTWDCFNDAKLVTGLSFVLDAAAEPETAKCVEFITPEENALVTNWGDRLAKVYKKAATLRHTRLPVANTGVWCNPPFDEKLSFIQKAYDESRTHNITICLLIPYEPQTIWWRCMVDGVARTVYEPRGRYNFYEPDGVTIKSGVNFGTCFVVFDGSYINNTQYVKFTPSALPIKKPSIDLISIALKASKSARKDKLLRLNALNTLNRK